MVDHAGRHAGRRRHPHHHAAHARGRRHAHEVDRRRHAGRSRRLLGWRRRRGGGRGGRRRAGRRRGRGGAAGCRRHGGSDGACDLGFGALDDGGHALLGGCLLCHHLLVQLLLLRLRLLPLLLQRLEGVLLARDLLLLLRLAEDLLVGAEDVLALACHASEVRRHLVVLRERVLLLAGLDQPALLLPLRVQQRNPHVLCHLRHRHLLPGDGRDHEPCRRAPPGPALPRLVVLHNLHRPVVARERDLRLGLWLGRRRSAVLPFVHVHVSVLVHVHVPAAVVGLALCRVLGFLRRARLETHGSELGLGQRGREILVLVLVEINRLDHLEVVPVDGCCRLLLPR
mmetsp:Transcript_15995/g.37920  ORF Transcript_15995/g.37920 Transcript_15995/m.37920 type:complete len:341 (-) Transcript_15995:797-1819(-)